MTSSGLVSQLPTVENRTSQIGEKGTSCIGVDNGSLPDRKKETAEALAESEWPVSNLQPSHHGGIRVAYPTDSVTTRRRQGYFVESDYGAPRLPRATSLPPVGGCEAGSRKGALKGLSRMRGNSHVRFLGEEVTAMPLPYPIRCNRPPAAPGGSARSTRWTCIFSAMARRHRWRACRSWPRRSR